MQCSVDCFAVLYCRDETRLISHKAAEQRANVGSAQKMKRALRALVLFFESLSANHCPRTGPTPYDTSSVDTQH
jgi:hypothetical protein